MSIHCRLAAVMLALTLHGQVHAGRVIGGHEAVPHSRPYMVLLERYMSDGTTKYCGGFLLSEDFVMSAAHCQAKSFTVLLGLHNIHKRTNEVQLINVGQTFPHEGFNESGLINDVMLLKLNSKAKVNNHVTPIALAGQDDGSLPKSCIVSGWGRADWKNEMMSPKLMEINVTLIDNKDCEKENLYCSEGETGPGQGDSGGPLVCEGVKAYGVVSAMVQPGPSGQTLFRFAKISDYRGWIISTIKKAVMQK
ncbi:granzyme B-like [Leuresthes tenuis]|uniref:granzyme B-like n=1 Tax=Leuresthes tenuis TaxID=355514 RepID=UPI003B512F5A